MRFSLHGIKFTFVVNNLINILSLVFNFIFIFKSMSYCIDVIVISWQCVQNPTGLGSWEIKLSFSLICAKNNIHWPQLDVWFYLLCYFLWAKTGSYSRCKRFKKSFYNENAQCDLRRLFHYESNIWCHSWKDTGILGISSV